MKKYEYVSLHIGALFGAKPREYRSIIHQYTSRGYRYAGHIPTVVSGYGTIKDLDLIFELDA